MRYTLVALVALAGSQLPSRAEAQIGCPPGSASDSARAVPSRPPDLLIRASVSARSVRFATQPRAQVRTSGCAALDTVIVTERVNLPDPVEPGVTYRDVRVGIEIRSWLDVRCVLPAPAGGAPADSVPARPADPCARILGTDSLTPTPGRR